MTMEVYRCLCDDLRFAGTYSKDLAVTIDDVSDILEVDIPAVKELIREGRIQGVVLGGEMYFDTKDIYRFGYWYNPESKKVKAYWKRAEMGENYFNCDNCDRI